MLGYIFQTEKQSFHEEENIYEKWHFNEPILPFMNHNIKYSRIFKGNNFVVLFNCIYVLFSQLSPIVMLVISSLEELPPWQSESLRRRW